MSSDHFSPWSARQGQSAFGFSWLGAALATTSLPFGAVNAPGQRYHPAIVAQAIATLGAMFPGRFWVALGSGEASNEHITGQGWPRKEVRDARLRECVDVIRALLAGEEVSHDGLVHVDRARLWTLPDVQPALICPAVSVATARTGADWADGLVTVNQPHDKLREMVAAYRDAGGRGKLALQVHVSYDPDPDRALAIAHDQWRSNVFPPPICWDLDTAEAFDVASEHVTPDDVAEGRPRLGGPRAARGLAGRVRRPRLRRDLPAPRRAGAARLPRRVRRARAAAARRRDARPGRGGGGMRITDTRDLWWKNAVVYCLDVETFMDWNGDGIGDFAGLAQRIDHLADLGVTCLWLMPFYPTAERDDGYDITDFYGVDPRLGTHGDLVEVIRTAKDRGMRVIVDLVVNHTSRKHPWFRSAEQSKDSPFRDFYVWRSDPPPDTKKDVVFPDQETSIWTLSEPTGEWYLHKFYKEQPDLNVTEPAGARRDRQGHRLLAAARSRRLPRGRRAVLPRDRGHRRRPTFPDPHDYLRALRALVGRRSGNGDPARRGEPALRAAAGVLRRRPNGDELTMQFDFIGMQALYLSLARADAAPLVKALDGRPALHPDSQWATFVRNHDELTLDKLSRRGAGRGVRRLRARGDDAGLRPRPAPAAAADAGRRPAPDPDGLQPAVLAARHPGAVLRRGDRDGGGPRRRGAARRPHADAVDVRAQRRVLRRPSRASCPGRW